MDSVEDAVDELERRFANLSLVRDSCSPFQKQASSQRWLTSRRALLGQEWRYLANAAPLSDHRIAMAEAVVKVQNGSAMRAVCLHSQLKVVRYLLKPTRRADLHLQKRSSHRRKPCRF